MKAPGIDTDTLGEVECCFTMAEEEYTWPDYFSDPVRIRTGLDPDPVDISSLGTAVIDSDRLLVVLVEQDYDEWFGPEVCVYVENRTDQYIGIYAETADADNCSCDYIYFGEEIAPGKRCAGWMSFEGEVRELRGIEKLTVTFGMKEAAVKDELNSQHSVLLAPVTFIAS